MTKFLYMFLSPGVDAIMVLGGCDGIAFTLTEILEERVQNGQIPIHHFVIG